MQAVQYRLPRVQVNTTFQIASDKEFKHILRTCRISSDSYLAAIPQIKIDMNGQDTMTVYVREKGRCPGHATNGKVYKVTLKKNTIVQLPTSPVVNHMKYGRPVIKKLGDNGEALQGAIFKVEYSAGSNWAPEGVWFLKSDENGNATFDSDHLVQNFEGQDCPNSGAKKTAMFLFCLLVILRSPK